MLNYIPRVTQLDAVQLDDQLEELLKQYLYEATQFLEPGLLQPFMPEIELLLRSWIFKYSLCNKGTTFGQEMLSLSYRKENFSRSKLYWYFGYTVGLKYLKERAIYSFTSNARVQRFVQTLDTFQVVGDVLNLLRFIRSGRHPLLIDFLLGLELTAEKLTREDLNDFSWTRELLWHNLIELIGTVLSLMSLFGFKSKVSSSLRALRRMWLQHPVTLAGTAKPAAMDVSTVCAYCSNNPVIPHTMGCPHIFCYYCISANKNADKNFACPKCHYNGNQIVKFVMQPR